MNELMGPKHWQGVQKELMTYKPTSDITTGQPAKPFDLRDSEVPQYSQPAKKGIKCRVLSVSQLYVTLEPQEMHALKQGQTVTIHAD